MKGGWGGDRIGKIKNALPIIIRKIIYFFNYFIRESENLAYNWGIINNSLNITHNISGIYYFLKAYFPIKAMNK